MNLTKLTDWGRRRWACPGVRAFCLAFLTACIVFVPFMIFDGGYFLFYGDFNVQQVPFYQMLHDAIRSGNWGWSWTTDLGANQVGSYTFYNLTSPFFWLTLPFPSDAVPYLMGPLYLLKFSCASLSAYTYLKRYTRNPDAAVLGGLLYAFCGFSVYNVFFNHFHEAIIIFPLLLAALDEYMIHGRRGVFALAVFASCFVNYYFFVGQVTFCILYWAVRVFTGSYGKKSFRRFAGLAIEAVLGLGIACISLAPTVLAVIQNNRVNSQTTGWSALLYGSEQRYLHILSSFFFMPDIPARANFTPDSNANWASIGMWLPLFSTVGVFAWMQQRKPHWSKKMIGILLLMAFVPILNNAFQLFNYAYYARWFYMMELMWVLATVRAAEDPETDWSRGFRWTFGFTVGIAVGIGLMPASHDSTTGAWTFGLEKYPERFWTYVAIALASLLLLYLLLPTLQRSRKVFLTRATAWTMVVASLYAIYFIGLGKTQSYDTHSYIIPYCLNGGDDLNLPDAETDQSFYRSDFYDAMDNVAMYWQKPSIQAFHSIVPGSVMTFYDSIGVERGVGSRPDVSHYAIRGLLSVKYLFEFNNDNSGKFNENGTTLMPGFSYYATQNGFDVYRNDAYIPMGFTYQYCISQTDYEAVTKSKRELVMLQALVVPDDQFDEVSRYLTPLDNANALPYTNDMYLQLCAARAQTACTSFETSGSGFTADIAPDRETYVFFSVPYESGWSAEIDGESAEIVTANVGFMAVRVGAGTHHIRFRYRTPGLTAGAAICLTALALLAIYLLAGRALDRRIRARQAQAAPEPHAEPSAEPAPESPAESPAEPPAEPAPEPPAPDSANARKEDAP